MYISPGGPAERMLSAGEVLVTEEFVMEKKKEMGLDKPFMTQYINWIKGFIRGNLGESLILHESVNKLIISKLPATIYLAGVSLGISLIISIPIAIFRQVTNKKIK